MIKLPESLTVPLAVSEFKGTVTLQHPHQRINFDAVVSARRQYNIVREEFKAKLDDIMRHLEEPASKRFIYEQAARRALYIDLGATMMLIAAASMERLYHAIGVSLLNRGHSSYVESVTFAQAVHSLANQYKHFGEWKKAGPQEPDATIVVQLVDDPVRDDAASEFLDRCGFADYKDFETALVSCSNGLTPMLPDGLAGLPTITVRPKAEPNAKD